MENFYKNFEDKFRGSFNEIKDRLTVYLPFLNNIKKYNKTPKAIDLGCGRGEWLELLKDNAFDAIGCDLDDGMVAECIKKGYNVEKKDAIEFLKNQKDDSVDIISGFQIAEHIGFKNLYSLIKETFRVLNDNGILIIETPNPENLRVSTLTFHLDPTHDKPLPPMLLEYLVEYYGFKKTFKVTSNGNFIKNRIKADDNILLSDVINYGGSPDYAIIAVKNIDQASMNELSKITREISAPSMEEISNIFENKIESKINLLNARMNACEAFIGKIKTLLWPLIKIYKISVFIRKHFVGIVKNFIKNIFQFIERQVAKHEWLKQKLKKILKKLPWLASLVYKIRNLTNPYLHQYIYEKNEYIIDKIEQKHTLEYIKNIKFKQLSGNHSIDEIILIGNANMHHSLASINRNIIFRLIDKIKISIIPYHTGYFDPLDKISLLEDEYNTLKKVCLQKYDDVNNSLKSRIALYHRYPIIEDVNVRYGMPIAIFFWEESKIPQHSIDILNEKYKGVIVSTWFVKKTLIDNGCYIPIKVADIPLKLPQEIKECNDDTNKNTIKLLHISSCFPRKGSDILLRAFDDACRKSSLNLTLTIKTFPNPFNNIKEELKTFVDKKFINRVKLIFDEHLTAKDIAELYEEHDVVVLPTRGEGLNMPAIEAAHYKKYIISTNYSGQAEFLDPSVSKLVAYKITKAYTNFDLKNSVWAQPSIEHVSNCIIELSNAIAFGKKDYQSLNIQKDKIDMMMFSDKNLDNFLSSIQYIYDFNNISYTDNISLLLIKDCNDEYFKKYITLMQNELNGIKIYTDIKDLDKCNTVVIVKNNLVHNEFMKYDDIIKNLKNKSKNIFMVIDADIINKDVLQNDLENMSSMLNEINRIFVYSIENLNALKDMGIIDNVVLADNIFMADDKNIIAKMYLNVFKAIDNDVKFLEYIHDLEKGLR